jgi:hypothetical protein
MTRKLKNDTEVEELEDPVTLEVYTKCPSKWKLIDMETGEEYIGQEPDFDKNGQCWKRVN